MTRICLTLALILSACAGDGDIGPEGMIGPEGLLQRGPR